MYIFSTGSFIDICLYILVLYPICINNLLLKLGWKLNDYPHCCIQHEGHHMLELHGVKYFTPKDISDKFPISYEMVIKLIETDKLDSCLIDGKTYVNEETVLDFFTEH